MNDEDLLECRTPPKSLPTTALPCRMQCSFCKDFSKSSDKNPECANAFISYYGTHLLPWVTSHWTTTIPGCMVVKCAAASHWYVCAVPPFGLNMSLVHSTFASLVISVCLALPYYSHIVPCPLPPVSNICLMLDAQPIATYTHKILHLKPKTSGRKI